MMDELTMTMTDSIKRYVKLHRKKAELDKELKELRSRIIDYCEEQQCHELEAGRYLVKLIIQERKEFDDQKLYDALPDPDLWRYISKADGSKVSGMLKMNVLSEEQLENTFTTKTVTLLKVDKK